MRYHWFTKGHPAWDGLGCRDKRWSDLKILQDLAAGHEALAAAFIDLQGLEESPAQIALDLFDGAGRGAAEGYVAAGAAVVAAGAAAQLAHHLPQNLPRPGMRQ